MLEYLVIMLIVGMELLILEKRAMAQFLQVKLAQIMLHAQELMFLLALQHVLLFAELVVVLADKIAVMAAK